MQKDNLADLLLTIEKDCETSDILIFYGSIDESEYSPVNNIEDEKKDWKNYLKILKALDCKVVTISVDKNDLEDFETVAEYIKSLEEVPLEELYSDALFVVQKHTGKVAAIAINFYHGLINYQLSIEADWCDDLMIARRALSNMDDKLEEENHNDENENFTDDQIEQLARKVISNPAYIEGENAARRRRICYSIKEVLDLKSNDVQYRVMSQAERIFKEEILPVKETQLRNTILDLKKQGFSKARAKAKLEISEGTINRHWYDT